MSVLIRGMEMPQNCDKCRFQSALRLYCDAMPYNFCGNTDDIERPDWCPLVEISTPHGRLVDIKSVEDRKFTTVDNEYERWWNGALDSVVDNASTVIEAEGSET